MDRITTRKALITGARGLLGHHVAAELEARGTKVLRSASALALERPPLRQLPMTRFDFPSLSEEAIVDFLRENEADTLIHFAAMSNVDECESRQDDCRYYNVALTEKLLRAANRAGARFVFASTNAVYDGTSAPYAENADRKPLHAYGRSKRDAEDAVLSKADDYLLFRFILSFGGNPPGSRDNPLTQILRHYRSGGRVLKMVDDVYANALYAGDAARAVAQALARPMRNETFNIAGGTRQSRYELAMSVKRAFALDDLKIEAAASSAFPTLVPRPRDTSFDCSKLERVLGLKPRPIEEALALCAADERAKKESGE